VAARRLAREPRGRRTGSLGARPNAEPLRRLSWVVMFALAA
jgi:hypothetical protein